MIELGIILFFLSIASGIGLQIISFKDGETYHTKPIFGANLIRATLLISTITTALIAGYILGIIS